MTGRQTTALVAALLASHAAVGGLVYMLLSGELDRLRAEVSTLLTENRALKEDNSRLTQKKNELKKELEAKNVEITRLDREHRAELSRLASEKDKQNTKLIEKLKNTQSLSSHQILTLKGLSKVEFRKGNYALAIRLMEVVSPLVSEDRDFDELRCRAYKNLKMYRASISCFRTLFKLHPVGNVTHLLVIESFILIKDFDGALTWIRANGNKIVDPNIATVFKFFELICRMMRLDNYALEYNEYLRRIEKNPINPYYHQFLNIQDLVELANALPLGENLRKDLVSVIRLTITPPK